MDLRRAIFSLLLALYVTCAGATTHVNDSGTWRQLREIHVNDSGTWRNVQEAYVNDGGTWRSVFKRADTFTFQAGTCTFFATPVHYGYDDGNDGDTDGSCGSITIGSATLSDGRIASEIITDIGTSGEFISIRGFGADPGSSYITSLSVGGTTVTLGTYSYSSGTATWAFSGISDLISGNSYAVELVHQ